jgi:hypothetical protein
MDGLAFFWMLVYCVTRNYEFMDHGPMLILSHPPIRGGMRNLLIVPFSWFLEVGFRTNLLVGTESGHVCWIDTPPFERLIAHSQAHN